MRHNAVETETAVTVAIAINRSAVSAASAQAFKQNTL